MGLILAAMGGAGEGAAKSGQQLGEYASRSALQQEAADITAKRDQTLEQFASAREQRGYGHAEKQQQQGFEHAESLATAKQVFDAEQNEANRGVTREQIASQKSIAEANNATALKIANIGGTVQPDKEGNILWIGKDGKATKIMDPNNPDQPLTSHKDLTPAAKAYSDVLKAQLVDLDRAEIAAMGDPAQLSSIKQRRAEYTGQLLNVLTGGIGEAGKPAALPKPAAQDVDLLKRNPAAKALFDQKFGAGAAERALGGGEAKADAPPAASGGAPLVEAPPGSEENPAPPGLISRALHNNPIARGRRQLSEREAAEEARKKEYGDAVY